MAGVKDGPPRARQSRGLSGLGDNHADVLRRTSARNRAVGVRLGRGEKLDDILASSSPGARSASLFWPGHWDWSKGCGTSVLIQRGFEILYCCRWPRAWPRAGVVVGHRAQVPRPRCRC